MRPITPRVAGLRTSTRGIADPLAVDVALLAEEVGALERDAAQFARFAIRHDAFSACLRGEISAWRRISAEAAPEQAGLAVGAAAGSRQSAKGFSGRSSLIRAARSGLFAA